MNGISIIIPAHNEAAVIGQTLRSILANRVDRPVQIVVVANACDDATAAAARAFAGVEVIETPIGGKTHALNLGDAAAKFFPRAYLDADIELSDNVLRKVIETFENDSEIHIAAPTPRHVYRGRNVLLSGYYKLWSSMPYVRNAIMGSGFYAIDQTLRARFGEFPAITADDKFIRNLAQPSERRVIEGCHCTIAMPGSFADLLRVKTRWSYGNLELSQTHPELNANDRRRYGGAVGALLLRPWLWIHLPAFIFVFLYARFAAGKRIASQKPVWDRDHSTRAAPAASADSSAGARPAQRPAA